MRLKSLVVICLCFVTIALAQQKVACVGNSITYGAGISDRINDAYPAALQKLLGDEYVVTNCGNSGKTMLKNGDFPLWVEPEFKTAIEMVPDIVVILLGTNDSKPQNWIYKDEFVTDYIAMIDTFRLTNPEVEIYACLPPPAFSVQWGITDSVITTDIIPMLHKIADSTKVQTINFYTPFIDSNELFPDDIHPNVEGSWEMAKIVYKAMTGKTVTTQKDVDLAKKKSVTVDSFNSSENPEALVDGDHLTYWSVVGGGSAIVDLGAVESIDMLQTDFGEEALTYGQYYTIDVSTDLTNWQRVVDKSTVGDSSVHIAIDKIPPTDARYVKLTPLGPVDGAFVAVGAFEFKVLKTADLHAPVFFIEDINPSSRYTKYVYHLLPMMDAGYVKALRADNEAAFTDVRGYRNAEVITSNGTIRPDNMQKYTTKAYYDGLEVISSDTLTLTWAISAVEDDDAFNVVQDFYLTQNYPNPFNPNTEIRFHLQKPGKAEIIIYDALGKQVKHLVKMQNHQGWQTVQWDGTDQYGNISASGVYMYRLFVDGAPVQTRKMMLLK